MSNDMTGPGTGGGVLSSLGDRMMGRASGSHAKVSKKSGPLDGLFLSQLIPALLLVLVGTITIWTASLTIADANFPRHLVGVALGLVVAVLIWRYDYRNLAGMTTVLFVDDVLPHGHAQNPRPRRRLARHDRLGQAAPRAGALPAG